MVATPGLDEAQLKRAVQALLKHVAKQHEGAKELFDDDELLYLVRASQQAPAVSKAVRAAHMRAAASEERVRGARRLSR
jgi:hypothetical protein